MTRMAIGLVASVIVSVAVLGGFATRGHAAARAERQATSKTSADGLIAFGDGAGVSVVPADGSSPAINVSGNQREASGPTWAPKGRKLAYWAFNGIWVVNADGTGRRQLAGCPSATCTSSDGLPVWSPKGRKIAWIDDDWDLTPVRVVSANGSHRRTIAQMCAGRDELANRPSWSPNGKWLVLASYCPQAQGIWIVRVKAGEGVLVGGASDGRQRLIWRGGVAGDPVWSPDGKTIAFVAGTGELWTMSPNGKDLHELTAAGPGPLWAPSWSPDSRRIAYLSPAGVRVVNADNTGAHTLLSTGDGQAAWSPDGKRLAVSQWIENAPPVDALDTIALNGQSLQQIATGNFDSEYSPPVWAP
jgi:Tol biopolymer transport system component